MPPSICTDRLKPAWFRWFLLALLVALAAVSATQGFRDALKHSQDFQWSGAKLLVAHIDPWAEYLRGNLKLFHLTQIPNYLPILYILIAPLGCLSLMHAEIIWGLLNIFFAVASAVIVARFYGMRRYGVLAVICLMLIATPTRNSIGNGQQGLLVLLLWCLSLIALKLSDLRSAVCGVSYFKFNFAPPAFLYLLFRGGIRAIAMSAVPSLLATVLVWFWLAGVHYPHTFLRLIFEPIAVSHVGYFPSGGGSNLMDVLEALLLFFHASENLINVITLGAAVLVCGIVLYLATRWHRGSSVQWQMALMATMSFGLFKHHNYDAVVLIFPLCYALRFRQLARGRIILLLLAYLWYIQRLVDLLSIKKYQGGMFVVQFVMLMVVLLMTYQLRTAQEVFEPDSKLKSRFLAS